MSPTSYQTALSRGAFTSINPLKKNGNPPGKILGDLKKSSPVKRARTSFWQNNQRGKAIA
ncbi:hypothetical protein [Picosynechococcus sp. PCC 7002]|uniref:hypothetical protein n=1 Tax=Picosynechococcus sp. (strain ATCC 27264 / PCC 7002 / PR-6) TaxID=32049 RepID=UPI0030DD2C9C